MRALIKNCDLAIKYKDWYDNLPENYKTNYYPNHKFVKDIKANLLIHQLCVCAYTEIRLDNIEQLKLQKWQEGIYLGYEYFDGELDHFDSSLRDKGRESWMWSNFFFIHHSINGKKNDTIVYNILKPDRLGYDPSKYLYYDSEEHWFHVSPEIDDPEERLQIKYMIDNCVLLNHGRPQRERKTYLNGIFKKRLAEIDFDLSGLVVDQFFTAFEMMKSKLS